MAVSFIRHEIAGIDQPALRAIEFSKSPVSDDIEFKLRAEIQGLASQIR